MIKGFNTVKVKDIGKVVTGHTPPTDNRDYYGQDYVFIKPTDMRINERFVLETEEKLSKVAFEKYKKSLIPPLSTCVVTIGSLGKKLCLTKEYCFTNQAVNSVIPYEEYDKIYVYYLFKYINPAVESLSNGTASGRDNVSKTSFENLNVIVPNEKKYQQRVGALLEAYDNILENNKYRIISLENIARELYKEWFVRFRFPDHSTQRFIRGIPSGWIPRKVKELVDRKKFGRTYKQDELNSKNGIIVIDQSTDAMLGFHNNEPDHNATSENALIVFGDHTCKMQLMIKPFSLAENVIPFAAKENIPIYYLYYLVESLVETTEYKRHWNDLTSKSVLLAPRDIQLMYSSTVKPLFEQIEVLKEQNIHLQQALGALIPRLISGKLGLKESKTKRAREIA